MVTRGFPVKALSYINPLNPLDNAPGAPLTTHQPDTRQHEETPEQTQQGTPAAIRGQSHLRLDTSRTKVTSRTSGPHQPGPRRAVRNRV